MANVDRSELLDKIVSWLNREPKISLAYAARFYRLTPSEKTELRNRIALSQKEG